MVNSLIRQRMAAAAAGFVSAGLLLGALAFQYIGGLAPCTLCYWQRYTHVAVFAAALLAIALPRKATLLLGFGTSLVAAGMALFHTGVERKWWAGLESCSGSAEDLSSMSGSALLSMDAPAPVVKCSDVAWEMLGLSMASWNGLVTMAAAVLWLVAWPRSKKG